MKALDILSKFLPLCSYSDVIRNGSWEINYGRQLPYLYDPWQQECPKLLSTIQNHTYYMDQRGKYSCLKSQYSAAHYLSLNGCNILPLKVSLEFLNTNHNYQLSIPVPIQVPHVNGMNNQKAVVYVGDSLIAQMYLSMQCWMETSLSHTYMSRYFHLVHDLFLRNDLPCDSRCEHNATFRNQHVFLHPCWSCRDGIRHSFRDFYADTYSWYNRLPNENVSTLIIGAGSWYNAFKGLINSTKTYEEMLHKMGNVFQRLRRERGTEVFWVGLPPVSLNGNLSSSLFSFEWKFFRDKNVMAKRILEPMGVHYIDTMGLTSERKRVDPAVSADAVHWCSPGKHSIPTFLNEIIYHILARKKYQNVYN
mmetsp:Transcript_2182/g.3429  ORF Transcript_2182/g.3429 Transcript_2182/m.3429 type:complete len:363 (+) Transcript_2182:94-1182(+)